MEAVGWKKRSVVVAQTTNDRRAGESTQGSRSDGTGLSSGANRQLRRPQHSRGGEIDVASAVKGAHSPEPRMLSVFDTGGGGLTSARLEASSDSAVAVRGLLRLFLPYTYLTYASRGGGAPKCRRRRLAVGDCRLSMSRCHLPCFGGSSGGSPGVDAPARGTACGSRRPCRIRLSASQPRATQQRSERAPQPIRSLESRESSNEQQRRQRINKGSIIIFHVIMHDRVHSCSA